MRRIKMLAGIDVGSTGLKVSLFDDKGQRLGYAYREYEIIYGQNGQAVINPEVWWNSLQSCFKELSQFLNLRLIKAIGISSANAIVLTDEHLTPLFPAIMQLDKRGAKMVDVIEREIGNQLLFWKTGNRNALGYQWGATLKWLQMYEAKVFSKVRRIYNPTSYLVGRLTGAYTMDITRAATTLLYNTEKREWDSELWDYFGLSLVEKPELFTCAEVVGSTNEKSGLKMGIQVVAGGIDTICATIGLHGGSKGDALIIGSVGRFAVSVEQWGSSFLNTWSWDGKQKISMTPVNNAGTALKWIRNLLCATIQGQTIDYPFLNQIAEQISPTSEGLLFLPYLNGASCPRWDETVRGTFLGMESYHTAGHMIRAVMEGVAFSLGENQQLLEQFGSDTTRPLYLGGGGARSPVWRQILSDVLGRELLVPKQTETETMGAAMLGGMAIGWYTREDTNIFHSVQEHIYPILKNRDIYTKAQQIFSRIYEPLKEIYQAGSKVVN